jgi:hypothetical protein
MECSSADSKEEMRWNPEGSIKMKKKFTSLNHSYKSSINVHIFTHQNDFFTILRILFLSNVSEQYLGYTPTKHWFDIRVVYFSVIHCHRFITRTKEVGLISVIISSNYLIWTWSYFSIGPKSKMDNRPCMLVTDDNSEVWSRFSKLFPGYNPCQYTREKEIFILETAVSENNGIVCCLRDMVYRPR